MKGRSKVLVASTFVFLGAMLFVLAPIVPQTARGLWNVPSPYPYCGEIYAPPPSVPYFVSPAYLAFHSGVVFLPQGEHLWWVQPVRGTGATQVLC